MHSQPALLWKQRLHAAEGDKQGKHRSATVTARRALFADTQPSPIQSLVL